MTGEWLAHCSACPVPEIANVFQRARIPFEQITGRLRDDPECWDEVEAWIEAARVAHVMAYNRLGLMGHYYNGMLDIYSDTTLQCATFGGHLEIVEVDELAALRRDGEPPGKSPGAWRTSAEQFDVQAECSAEELERAARTSVALDRLVEDTRSRVAGLLLHGHGQRRERRRHPFHHPGQLAADGARHSRWRESTRLKTRRP